MTRARGPSEDERRLFEETFKDAKPLKNKRKAARKEKATASHAKAQLAKKHSAPAVQPYAHVRATPAGGREKPTLDGHTREKLRKGLIDPDAKIDLHGMTEAVAHHTLLTFLRAAAGRGCRLVLVVTGKGAPAADPHAAFDLGLDRHARGVLKRMTPRWLAEPEFAQFVAGSAQAHIRHGGSGAMYVALRRRK